MNRKKWMAMALIAAMSLTVMTGCGKKEESAPKAGAELSGKITASAADSFAASTLLSIWLGLCKGGFAMVT